MLTRPIRELRITEDTRQRLGLLDHMNRREGYVFRPVKTVSLNRRQPNQSRHVDHVEYSALSMFTVRMLLPGGSDQTRHLISSLRMSHPLVEHYQ